LDADIIITATGLELLFVGGMELVVDGEKVDISQRLTYKGMMLEGVPNLAIAVGYTNASWTLKCDLTCDYVCRLLNHLHRSGLRQAAALNRDATVSPEPLLGLSSGYIQRSMDRFPKSGSKFPWQVHQSFLKDYRIMKRSGLEDDAMTFSNPVPSDEPVTAGV
jgi:cation diffusion facilitator CzcD-associated flavoprotein CzcO